MPVVRCVASHRTDPAASGSTGERGSRAAARGAAIVTKKRKAFKTSPSVRIPRKAVERMQDGVLAGAELAASLRKSIAAAAHDNAIYVEALRDLMKFFDKVAGSSGSWGVDEVKRLEEIRLLSLGI
jgi:hypothetical protein